MVKAAESKTVREKKTEFIVDLSRVWRDMNM